ncbi:hypothetical protein NDN08_000952 [Rhodosorus marinus]|uniref:Programmed cell death protein 2 C-terminal domain-containing protein n=1 Tax=Rhodosorus marinus TaxID=101924 RepID=A0AAV8UQZ3_9RHOD|nr:hypothetical protein NDN08_000952 [Rhodosorus marinus]
MGPSQLGFPASWTVDEEDPLTSKLGGRPTWLSEGLNTFPACRRCERELTFLGQVHAPVDHQYERCLYIFACERTECSGSNSGWVVLRQVRESPGELKDEGGGTSSETDDGWGAEDEIDMDELTDLLELSSIKREKAPETQPQGKPAGSASASKVSARSEWRCTGIEWGEEPCTAERMTNKEKQHVLDLQRRYEEEVASIETPDSADGWQGETYEKDNLPDHSKAFQRLMKIVERCPEQCMRYCYGGTVLWLSEQQDSTSVCQLCGSERVPELQLLPNVIYLLGEDRLAEGMDWGTAVLLTCSASCSISGTSAEEQVAVQNM